MSEFHKISVIGLGLIGTSILHAINAKKNDSVTTFAYDLNSKHRNIVSEMKIATFVCDKIDDASISLCILVAVEWHCCRFRLYKPKKMRNLRF